MTRSWSARDYTFAGLATMSRQISFTLADYAISGVPAYELRHFLTTGVHQLSMRVTMLETLLDLMIVPVEQSAYPILLQISEQMDQMIDSQIRTEEDQLAVLELLLPLSILPAPLLYIALSTYVDSFHAQIDAHKAVLNHFRSAWRYIDSTIVTGVVDGDTFLCDALPSPVRIEGIDAPELGTPQGKAAKEYLFNILFAHWVKLRVRPWTDRYGRAIAQVFYIPSGDWVAFDIVRAGHARFLYPYPYKFSLLE